MILIGSNIAENGKKSKRMIWMWGALLLIIRSRNGDNITVYKDLVVLGGIIVAMPFFLILYFAVGRKGMHTCVFKEADVYCTRCGRLT